MAWPDVLADGSVRITHTTSEGERRWRTFRWTGSGFDELGQPARIPSATGTGLSLSVTPSSVAVPRGKLTITVRNNGTEPSDFLRLEIVSKAAVEIAGAGPISGLAKASCT